MTPDSPGDLQIHAAAYFRGAQERIVAGLEGLDGGRFGEEAWERPGGGGGRARVLSEGDLFEKAGVNFSEVSGEIDVVLGRGLPGKGRTFWASGVSLVLHPRSPRVPTLHANLRCLSRGGTVWFGGGTDLTPYYVVDADAVLFHRSLRAVCDRHHDALYGRLKAWCDRYFFLPHRDEPRGAGGIFFDHHFSGDADADLAFTRDVGLAFLDVFPRIVRRRMSEHWTEAEREHQLVRRGRYVEFNLIHDRGTLFGLKTGGNVEAILMSLPPEVKWP
jgi:coproporphyrinogen III oxidase